MQILSRTRRLQLSGLLLLAIAANAQQREEPPIGVPPDGAAKIVRPSQASKPGNDSEEIRNRAIQYAIAGTSAIRNVMLDPTAFTVLQVIAAWRQGKKGEI